jgi:hypothetical protein
MPSTNADADDRRAPSAPATTGDTVTVASKLPYDLIIRGFVLRDEREQMANGSYHEYKIWRPSGETHRINGTGGRPMERPPAAEMAAGFALTHGVPADLMDRWMRDNAGMEAVVNGLIFVTKKRHDATDEAFRRRDLRTGLEPIDPNDPGRSTGVMGVEALTAA